MTLTRCVSYLSMSYIPYRVDQGTQGVLQSHETVWKDIQVAHDHPVVASALSVATSSEVVVAH